MVSIPAGCFNMGSPTHEYRRNANEYRHRVCVKRFKMATHEVTVAEFRAFINATHYFTDAEIDFRVRGCWSYDADKKKSWDWWPWSSWRKPLKGPVNERQPVTCVSFHDIQQYIDWLNQNSGRHYRLPTEAEWEYAARAGSNHTYFWGNNPRLACRYANVADLTQLRGDRWPGAHRCQDNYFHIAPVSKFQPNQFGLYDMLGNVWEWTCSRYDKDYKGLEQRCLKYDEQENVFITVKGGGWNSDPPRLRAAYRNWESPWIRLATWGFRLVQDDSYPR